MTNSSGTVDNATASTPKEELDWSSLKVDVYIKIAIIAALIYWFFNHEIYRIVHRWINDPSWSHGVLIPLFSIYFIIQHKDEILAIKPKPNYFGLAGLLAVITFYFLNDYIQIGYFGQLSPIAAIGFVVLFLCGWKLLKHLWLPVVFLFFAVPLPQGIYSRITIPMRILAAKIANALLNLVPELTATANGVVIEVVYKGKPLVPGLDVAEACSGMRLLMAFLALGVAMAYLHHRALWQRLVLLLSTVPIAILCNVIRVTITGFIYILWDPKYATGIYHDMLGMMMLPLAFGLYGGLAWFLSNLIIDASEANVEEDIIVRKK